MSDDTALQHNTDLHTAVLFLVFNRIDTTKQVFEAIRKAKPPRLYIASDGPRDSREGEAEKVQAVRNFILTNIDWECEVNTLFREKNLGCRHAPASAITWFYENEEQGIILEDDCLPHADFFPYCEALLNRYANDERVWVITGNNFQNGVQRGNASYYFSRYNHVWGWATWRRAWEKNDFTLSFWPQWKQSQAWRDFLSDSVERNYWQKIFDKMYQNGIDAWDYPWTASIWYHNGLTATPIVNLVSNIGFGADATHTTSKSSELANITAQPLGVLTHPSNVVRNMDADSSAFDHHFGGHNLRWPKSMLRLPRRIVGKLYRQLIKRNN